MRLVSFLLLFFVGYNGAFCQHKEILALINQKRYLALPSQVEGSTASRLDKQLVVAFWANAVGKSKLSQKALAKLTPFLTTVDSLGYQLKRIEHDNYVKTFAYARAAKTAHELITTFNAYLSPSDVEGMSQEFTIWQALANQPKQYLTKQRDTHLSIAKDKAGLWRIPVQLKDTSLSFVFDTGAGISCLTTSLAKRLNVTILPDSKVSIKGGITGTPTEVQLGIYDHLTIGNVHVKNALFLVFPDSALSFGNGAYKIDGIIGFPIIKEFEEFTLTKKQLIIPKQASALAYKANMTLDLLKPILYLTFKGEELPFTFDTGATTSIFSDNFYHLHQDALQKEGKETFIHQGGAGGEKKIRALKVPSLTFQLLNANPVFSNVEVSLEPLDTNGSVYYGNLGQDLLNQFAQMTISFKHSYIKFE
ncbi:aspartyl protease family protein [Spirosoma gilvum]